MHYVQIQDDCDVWYLYEREGLQGILWVIWLGSQYLAFVLFSIFKEHTVLSKVRRRTTPFFNK